MGFTKHSPNLCCIVSVKLLNCLDVNWVILLTFIDAC